VNFLGVVCPLLLLLLLLSCDPLDLRIKDGVNLKFIELDL